MRIGNIRGRLALIVDAGSIDVAACSDGRFGPDPQAVYADWDAFVAWAARLDRATARSVPFDPDDLASPAPAPGQLFAIGINYRDHAAEASISPPSTPAVFTKFRSSISGPRGEIELPTETVDWEAELVVVVGRGGRSIPVAEAWSAVAGLTVGQDLSERTLQRSGPAPQFSLAKSFERFTPMGPWLITPDELRARGHDPDALELGCAVNGEPVQSGNSADLVFPVPVLIAQLSAVCELSPGDVIFTGTPAGVGACRTPQCFLQPGDELVTTISGIGEMRHRMVASRAASALTF